jgi:hypothetical protein
MKEQMSPEERKFRATDAKQLLENDLFIEAFKAVETHISMAALTCDVDNKEKAQRIIISTQLLAAIKREIQRVVNDGAMAEVQIAELEQKRKFAMFRR